MDTEKKRRPEWFHALSTTVGVIQQHFGVPLADKGEGVVELPGGLLIEILAFPKRHKAYRVPDKSRAALFLVVAVTDEDVSSDELQGPPVEMVGAISLKRLRAGYEHKDGFYFVPEMRLDGALGFFQWLREKFAA